MAGHVVGATIAPSLLTTIVNGPPIRIVTGDVVNRAVTVTTRAGPTNVILKLRLPQVNIELEGQNLAGTDVVTKTEVRDRMSKPAME